MYSICLWPPTFLISFINIISFWSWSLFDKLWNTYLKISVALGTEAKELMATPKRMNFWKKFQTAFDPHLPPLIFGKWCCKFCIIFVLRKPCLKVQNPKLKWPPASLELFRKFIRFGVATLPKGGKAAKWGKSTTFLKKNNFPADDTSLRCVYPPLQRTEPHNPPLGWSRCTKQYQWYGGHHHYIYLLYRRLMENAFNFFFFNFSNSFLCYITY